MTPLPIGCQGEKRKFLGPIPNNELKRYLSRSSGNRTYRWNRDGNVRLSSLACQPAFAFLQCPAPHAAFRSSERWSKRSRTISFSRRSRFDLSASGRNRCGGIPFKDSGEESGAGISDGSTQSSDNRALSCEKGERTHLVPSSLALCCSKRRICIRWRCSPDSSKVCGFTKYSSAPDSRTLLMSDSVRGRREHQHHRRKLLECRLLRHPGEHIESAHVRHFEIENNQCG
jgi:hypothetical protein